MKNADARPRDPFQNESVLEVISTSRATLSDFVAADLALGLTHCATANLTNSPEKLHHLLKLAREVLATVETCMELTPAESFTDVLENADRLRSAVGQLEAGSRKQEAESRKQKAGSRKQKAESGTSSRLSLLPPRS